MAAVGGVKKAAGAASEDGDFVALRARREVMRQLLEEEGDIWGDESPPLSYSDLFSPPSPGWKARRKKKKKKSNKGRETIDEILEERGEELRSLPVSQAVQRPDSGRTKSATARIFDLAVTATADHLEELLRQLSRMDVVHPDTGLTLLLTLLQAGRADLARVVIDRADVTLLCKDCDVTVASLKGKKNALHFVTELNDVDLAKDILNKIPEASKRKAMLTQETPVQIQGQRPRTLPCCHLAAFKGSRELVVLYLSLGVAVDAVNSKKDTALLWAARWNHLDTVKELLSRRADSNIENDKGSTALYWAVRYGHVETVRVLISQGRADVHKTRKLGLVSPLILACALGYLDIAKLLLDGGADSNVCIRGKERPIHHAAREGYSQVIDYLLQKGARIDEKDEAGDTALLHAARYGHARCVQLLLAMGAKYTTKNHMGDDLISLALASDNNDSLKVVLYFVKGQGQAKGLRSPLLLAASGGHVAKVTLLLTMGFDPGDVDDEGNTMMHYAATANQDAVITAFHDKVRVDLQNYRGNTALHEACSRGHAESISALIASKATASIRNNLGETALHIVAHCSAIQPETVKRLMDYVIKSHAWESLNIKDNEGNNALHVAAKVARPEVMWEFRHMPFKVKDAEGNIALHEAVRAGEPEALTAMLDIYETMKRDADINEQNNSKETVLQLAAREGFAGHVHRLVILGADLAAKDARGNTVFHTLTELSASQPQRAKTFLAVFQALLDEAVTWWCMRHQLHVPSGDRGAVLALQRQAFLQLLTDTYNRADLNVIALACQVGAVDVVQLVTSKRGLMCLDQGDTLLYNVTNMTPLTNNSTVGCCGRGAVVPRPSYIEYLLSLDKPEVACRMLDIQPFRQIERAYSSVAAWTYIIIMIIHIIYMSLLSYSGVTLLEKRRKDPDDDTVDGATLLLYVVTPLEPVIILLYNLYRLANAVLTGQISALLKLGRGKQMHMLSKLLYVALPVTIGVVYSVLVIVWMALYLAGNSSMDYVFSVAVCIGWMYTISFTRGVRIIHYFWRMIQHMLVKDILKFLFIYLFVLLAFAFALHSVFQISQAVSDSFPTPFDTAFLVFNLMIGMGDLFDDQLATDMQAAGRSLTYVKIVYLVYMVMGTILLLNLLIAMMNDSYSSILTHHSVTWRLESVQLGVDIEKSFPASIRLFSRSVKFRKNPAQFKAAANRLHVAPGNLQSVADSRPQRGPSDDGDVWVIAIPASLAAEDSATGERTEAQALQDLKTKVTSVEQRLAADLQLVRHDLDEIRTLLKNLPHKA